MFRHLLAGIGLVLTSTAWAASAPSYTVEFLADLPGGMDSSESTGIDEQGWVVGYGTAGNANGGAGTLHATLWRDAQVIDLGSGNATSNAQDVNNRGQIVGAHNGRATLWRQDQQPFDLNTRVDGPPFGTELATAMSINDAGQITGWANNAAGLRVGYVLTEVSAVPEPGSWALMLAGLLAAGTLARRRRRA